MVYSSFSALGEFLFFLVSGVSDKDEVLGFELCDEIRIPEGVGAEVEDCDIGFGVVGLEPGNDRGLVTEG